MEDLWARQFGGGNGDNDNDDNGNDGNSTNGMGRFGGGGGNSTGGGGGGRDFAFQATKSIRTSTIILSIFNVVAAFATAIGIIWDGYATAKRNNPKYTFRYGMATVPVIWGEAEGF